MGLPALVIAGGPSLDSLAPSLAALRERMVLVSVNTPLRACRERGVEPDFTVVVDPQFWASRSLDWTLAQDGVLVAEPSACPRIFRRETERFFLCSSLFPLGETLEAAVGEKGRLGAGGSVSTSAWDLARLLGARPLYAAGLDLGFPGHAHPLPWLLPRGDVAVRSGPVRPGGIERLPRSPRHRVVRRPVGRRRNRRHGSPDAAVQVVVREPAPDASRLQRADTVPGRRCHHRDAAGEPRGRPRPPGRQARDRPEDGAGAADPRRADGRRGDGGEARPRHRGAGKTAGGARVPLEPRPGEQAASWAACWSPAATPSGCLEDMDAIDQGILAVSARSIAGFLIQSVIHGIMGEGERRPGSPGDRRPQRGACTRGSPNQPRGRDCCWSAPSRQLHFR